MKKSLKKVLSTLFVMLMVISVVGTVSAQPGIGFERLLSEDTEDEERIIGNGTLFAEGRGKALLEGTGWVYLNGVGHIIVIGKDVTVYTDGQGKVTHLGELVTIYCGKGVIKVVGDDMVILVRARGKLAASGEGMAILRGDGDFKVHKWKPWPRTDEPCVVDGVELTKVEY